MTTTKPIPATDMLNFFCNNGGEVSFSCEFFARHSEHVELRTWRDGNVSFLTSEWRGDRLRVIDGGWFNVASVQS